MKIYDLIIIGAGPAGLIAAKTAIAKGLHILIIEKGLNLNYRKDLISGWFGHALFTMNNFQLDELLNNSKATSEILRLFKKISPEKNFASYLFNLISPKADLFFNTKVQEIYYNKIFIVKTKKQKFKGKKCLIATGRNSIKFVNKLCTSFNLEKINGGAKVGVRVEIPTFKLNNIIENIKGIEDIRINSFVGEWEELNIISAFGYEINKKSGKTNFRVGFESKEVSNIIRNIQIINILANDRLKKERINDFMEGKSILKHIDDFNILYKIFKEINNNLPHFINYAIMYVPEVRFNGILPVDINMKTNIPNLYGAGECTNKVSNLIGAMASGLIVAKTILKEN